MANKPNGKRFSIALAAICVLLSGTACQTASHGGDHKAERASLNLRVAATKRFSVSSRDCRIGTILVAFSKKWNVNIVLDVAELGLDLDAPVSFSMKDVTLETALKGAFGPKADCVLLDKVMLVTTVSKVRQAKTRKATVSAGHATSDPWERP